MKQNLMNLNVWNLVCNGYTKFPPLDKEVKKKSKALSNIFCSITYSTLNKVMHYTSPKKVWDMIQVIQEEIPKRELPSNPISKNVSKMTNGVDDSK